MKNTNIIIETTDNSVVIDGQNNMCSMSNELLTLDDETVNIKREKDDERYS